MSKDNILIVGLGNPGEKYVHTRHNIGFDVIDSFEGLSFREKFSGLFAQTEIQDKKVFFLKPQTFMNNSGKSVFEVSQFFKEDLQIIVIHDDMNLPYGKIKIKAGGGHGGHNGIRSILDHLKFDNFIRIRVGIGRPASKDDVLDYVLSKFVEIDAEAVISSTKEIIEYYMKHGLEKTTNIVNSTADARLISLKK